MAENKEKPYDPAYYHGNLSKLGVSAVNEYVKRAEEFCKFLATAPIYANYLKTRSNISVNLKLSSEMKEFKRLQLEYELSVLQNGQTDFEKEKELSRLYSRLVLHPEARDYLNCEKVLLDTLNTIGGIIDGACPIDLDF